MTAGVAPRPRRAWWVTLLIGIVVLVGAVALMLAPGFRVSSSAAFGETLSVDVPAGEYAIYVTPSDQWGAIRCEGTVPDGDLEMRIGMTQQGVALPQAWDAKGSFLTGSAGTVHLTCTGPVDGGRVAIGPVVSFLDLVGAGALGIVGLAVVGVGVIMGAAARRRPAAG